jgi:hypothetical protein
MAHKSYLLVCCLVAFMALASRPTVKIEMPFMVPSLDVVPLADDETAEFITTYLGHGKQFNPD